MYSVREIERRVLTACKTIRALPDKEMRFFGVESGWPEFVRDEREAYGYEEAKMRRFKPNPADVSDCLDALALCRVLVKREYKYLWWRSFDVSFSQIASRIGRSDETARTRYRDAILKVWHEANTQQSIQDAGMGHTRSRQVSVAD